MQTIESIIIGGGPCGLSAAIEQKKKGIETLVIEKGNVVESIYNYPTHQTFFSSSDKLSIGDIPLLLKIVSQDVIKRLYIIGKSLNIINLTYIHSKKF